MMYFAQKANFKKCGRNQKKCNKDKRAPKSKAEEAWHKNISYVINPSSPER